MSLLRKVWRVIETQRVRETLSNLSLMKRDDHKYHFYLPKKSLSLPLFLVRLSFTFLRCALPEFAPFIIIALFMRIARSLQWEREWKKKKVFSIMFCCYFRFSVPLVTRSCILLHMKSLIPLPPPRVSLKFH